MQPSDAPSDLQPSEALAQRLKALRQRQGFSAQDVADRVREAGGSLDRNAVSKIEGGRRGVSLDEAFVLALVLNVAPVHLFVPVTEQAMQVGKWTLPASRVREWVRGRYPLPSQDSRRYLTEVPDEEWDAVAAAQGRRQATPEEVIEFFEGPEMAERARDVAAERAAQSGEVESPIMGIPPRVPPTPEGEG